MKKIMIPTTYKPYEMPDYKEYNVPNKVVEYIEHLEKQEKQTIKELEEELKELRADYSMVVTENKKLKTERNKAIEFIEKNIELNNGALSNREELIVSKHDLIKNETALLNCLINILKGSEE